MKSGLVKDSELPVLVLLGVPTLLRGLGTMLEGHEVQTQALDWLKPGFSSVTASTSLAAQGNQRCHQSSQRCPHDSSMLATHSPPSSRRCTKVACLTSQ
jgi:hypothetical protein